MKRLSLLVFAVYLLFTPVACAVQEDSPILSIGILLGSDKNTCIQYMEKNADYFNGYYRGYQTVINAVDEDRLTFFPNNLLGFSSGGVAFEFDDDKLIAITAALISDADISMSNASPTEKEVEEYIYGQIEIFYRVSDLFAAHYGLPMTKDVVGFDVKKGKWLNSSNTDEMVKLLSNADASIISKQYGNALLLISSLSGASNGYPMCPLAIVFFTLSEE